MLRKSIYVLLFLLLAFLLCVFYLLVYGIFEYGKLPVRPVTPERTRPSVRPVKNCPRRPCLPSQGRSRYLHRRKPNGKNTDKSILLQLMGDDYQTSWMSDEKPNPDSEVSDLEGMPWEQEILLEQFQQLNLTEEFRNLQPELLPLEDFIKSWLLKRSSCPVKFTWTDLGPTFWPRWVRKGECLDLKGYCSFPAGMHCVPAATTTVHILRWRCKYGKLTFFAEKERQRRSCDWYKIPYPITIDCFCTC